MIHGWSINCRAQQEEPKPHSCAGCERCWCHSVSPPANFRAQVEAAKNDESKEE